MLKAVTFSGWGHVPQAVEALVPKNCLHVVEDYLSYKPEHYFSNNNQLDVDLAIGWSLGGRVLAERVKRGTLKANEIWLFAVPFNPLENIDNFIKDFQVDEEKAIQRFSLLTVKGHENQTMLLRELRQAHKMNLMPWLETLREGLEMDVNAMPRIRHWVGANDALLQPNPLSDKETILPSMGHALPYELSYTNIV